MRAWRVYLAAMTLACAGVPAVAQPAIRTLDHQGVAREFIVANAVKDALRPLVLVLHGRRDPGALHRSSPALDALAAREGFVAVYPAGLGGVWNWPTRVGTEAAPLSKVGEATADDLGFLTRLIDRLIAERIADPLRVYVSGASMGGFMTFGLMCATPERIAAAAALIATMTQSQIETCKPSRAVPLAMLAGTLDTLVLYDGIERSGSRLLSIDDALAFWVRMHDCRDTWAEPVVARAAVSAGSIRTQRRVFGACGSKYSVQFFRVEGGGHTLPSLRPPSEDERKRFGPRSTEFETSEEVWAFLKRFQLSR